jgi:soluble lytic murein transglycosylase
MFSAPSRPVDSCVVRLICAFALALILGAGPGIAKAGKQAQSEKLPDKLTADQAFVIARNAALQADAAKLEAAARKIGKHPLAEYVGYWRLRLRLLPVRNRDGDSRGSDGSVDDAVRKFLADHQGKLVAELLRRDWMLDLGRRRQWPEFLDQYAAFAQRSDTRIECFHQLARSQDSGTLDADAEALLFATRELGEGCIDLIETLAAKRVINPDQIWQRIKLSLEIGALGSVRRLAPRIGITPGALEAALQRPAKIIANTSDPRLQVIAAVQLARQDPERAEERLDALGELPRSERAFVISQIAAQSMRRLLPQSLSLTHRALGASASDETWTWLARAALRESDWPTLHAIYESMGPQARNDPAWIYWHARADRELGRPQEAREQLRRIAGQFNFYGLLAAEELGSRFSPPAAANKPDEQELAWVNNHPGISRAVRLYDLGLRADGNREWNFAIRTMSDRQLLATAEWACRRELLDRCVNTADRTQHEHDFALRYITPFRDRLTPFAEQHELDPAWIYGLIRQESRFMLAARSSARAQGLMQIIPPTAKWIAGKLGVRNFRVEQLNDLDTNLRFGTYYLKTVHDGLDGSPVLASAGYNAGPGRPRRWRGSLPGSLEGAAFAEIIPFQETRDYVQNVIANATVYAALLSGRPQSLKDRLGRIEPGE